MSGWNAWRVRLHHAAQKTKSVLLPSINALFASGAERLHYITVLMTLWRRELRLLVLFTVLSLAASCNQAGRRTGIPAGAQATLDSAIEDVDAGRYEKLYQEAADEWRQSATLDQSVTTLKTLHEKLGAARVRDFDTAHEEQTSTAPIPGHSLVVVYNTSFDRGQGMETFTLIQHGGSWYLARYFVTSTALK